MRWQQARFAEAESKVKIALAPKPPQPQRNAEFDNGVRDATALLSGKQFDAAIRKFDQLRSTDAAEYGKSGLAARRDEAVKGLAGQLTDEARALIQNGRFRDASAKLRQADQTLPGQKPVADALAEIKKREEDYQRLKTEGQAAFSARNYSSAREKFDQARVAHPEQFDADNLVARLTEASTLANTSVRAGRGPDVVPDGGTRVAPIDAKVSEGRRFTDMAKQLVAQGKYAEADAAYASALNVDAKNQEALDAVEKAKRFKALRDQGLQLNKAKNVAGAQKMLIDARNVDAARFAREGLASTLGALTPSNAPEPSKVALQEGLLALLNGDAEKSIAVLEPALSSGGDRSASLHASLGVAYATRALSAPKPDDRTRLREKAVEQFKLAASAQPGYRLSDRIVSPAIIKIYEQSQ
jgi:Arc/MetJ-type ribon-helix-helix transcriptional regulator